MQALHVIATRSIIQAAPRPRSSLYKLHKKHCMFIPVPSIVLSSVMRVCVHHARHCHRCASSTHLDSPLDFFSVLPAKVYGFPLDYIHRFYKCRGIERTRPAPLSPLESATRDGHSRWRCHFKSTVSARRADLVVIRPGIQDCSGTYYL